jgi:hypothetical protein
MPEFWPITFKGLRATCTCYINDPTRGTVLLSLVGSVTVLNGLWAAFLSNETLLLPDEIALRRIPRLEDDPQIKTLALRRVSEYRTVRARLKETGKRQLVLIHQQATQGCAMDQAFYVLADDGQTPLARFFHQFTLAVAVCARREWSAVLWEYGRTQHLIEPCDAHRVDAWRVEADEDAWAEVVRQGIAAHAMH